MKFPKLAVLGIAAIAIAFFSHEAIHSLSLFEFGDESEKLVAGSIISEHEKLYANIFAHHGPVPYIISQVYANFVSRTDFSYIRIATAFLAMAGSASIYISPIFGSRANALIASSLYLGSLSAIWIHQGSHMILYQSIAGLIYAIPLSQMVLPCFAFARPKRLGLAASGFALALIAACSYSYMPSLLALLVSAAVFTLSEKEYRNGSLCFTLWFISGALVAIAAIGTWLIVFANPFDYYNLHIVFNQSVYKDFIHFKPLSFVKPILKSRADITTFSYFLIAISMTSLYCQRIRLLLRPDFYTAAGMLSLFISMTLLNPRGEAGIQTLAITISSICLASCTSVYILWESTLNRSIFVKSLAVVLPASLLLTPRILASHTPSSPHNTYQKDFSKARVSLRPMPGDQFEITRLMATNKRDTLALVFNPSFYIFTGIKPRSGTFYYLPWQAEYRRRYPGQSYMDICSDLSGKNAPTTLWYDGWKVWDKYSITDYEPCVPRWISVNYHRLNNTPLYIRKQNITNPPTKSKYDSTRKASTPLSRWGTLPIHINSDGRQGNNSKDKTRYFGVNLATYDGKAHGLARITFISQSNRVFSRKLDLSKLSDNSYYFVKVPDDTYVKAMLQSIGGSGISVWNAEDQLGKVQSCIITLSSKNTYTGTPGCPP